MEIQEIASKLVSYCREGNFNAAYDELYAKDIVSVEPVGAPAERLEGIEAVLAKSKQFEEMVENFHSNEVSDPIVAENFFTVSMKMNLTFKGAPGPMDMEEICVYGVKDGKIASEQFFFTPQPMA